MIGSRFLLRSVSRLSSSLAGNEFGTIDFLQVFFGRTLCVSLKFLLVRGIAILPILRRENNSFCHHGGPVISSKSPRLITSRTARNGAKFFDRSIPRSLSRFSESLSWNYSQNNSLWTTLYSKRTNFVFLACPKHKRSIDIHTTYILVEDCDFH